MKKVKSLRLISYLMLLAMIFNSSNIVFAEMGKKDEIKKEINLNDYIEDMRMFKENFEQIQFYEITNDSIIFYVKKDSYVERINNGENQKLIIKNAFAIKSKGIKKIGIEHPDGSKLEASIGDWEKGILIPKISHDNGYFYRYWEPFKFIFELESGENVEKVAKFVLNVPISLEEYGEDKFIEERGNSSENKSTMRVGLSYEVFGNIKGFNDIEKLLRYGKEILKVKPFNMKVAVEENNYSYDKKLLKKVPAISKIKIDNKNLNMAGYEGLIYESEISENGLEIPFNSFGAKNKETGELIFGYDEKNPPIVTYEDYLGNVYYGNLEFYSLKEDGISLNVEIGKFPRYESDKYFNVWIKEKDEELKKEVVLKAGKEYILVAIDGDRSKFTEWSFTDEGLNENFGEYFVGERKDKEITFKMTEKLMKKFEDMKLETINVKGDFNAYNRVEVEIKGEKNLGDKIIQTNRRNISLNNITGYDENSSKYKIALESILKEEEYSHKIEDEKFGTIYLISKDNEGNVVKRFSDADGKDTLLIDNRNNVLIDNKLVNNNEKKVEFIAVPNAGQSFSGFQIKTEAMDIIESGNIKSEISPNPKESGFYLENKSPYIVIELNNMSRKDYSLKVDALFKDFNTNDKIIDIEKSSIEYIKGYTKKDGLFPAFLKVKYEGKEEKSVLPVIWEDVDMENLKAGKHNIQGHFNNPNFKEKAEIEVHIKEIKEIKDREKSEVLLHPNIFDETFYASFYLPKGKKVKLEIGEGKDEERELDIKWKQVSYTKENNYRVRNENFSAYAHGKYMVEGEVKGFAEKLIYNMEVIPGINVSFEEDDLFEYRAGDMYAYKTIFSEDKKAKEIVEDIKVDKRNGYKFLGWYDRGSISSHPLEIRNEIKQDFPKIISEKDLNDYRIIFRTKWQQVGVKEVSPIEVLKDSDLPKNINITTTEDDNDDVEVLEWQKTEELKVGQNTLIAKIHWGMETDENGHSTKKYKENEVEVTVIVEDKIVEQKEFTIEFNSNGGTKIDSMIVKENQVITKPKDPTKEGHKFIGWYENANFANIFNVDTPITKDIALYAKWEEIEVIIESVPEIIEEVDIGSTFELPKMIRVIMNDKNEKSVDIKNWNPAIVDTSKGGTFNFEGTIEGTDKKAKLTLTIKEVIPPEINMVVLIRDEDIIAMGEIKDKEIKIKLPDYMSQQEIDSVALGGYVLKIITTEGATVEQDRGYNGDWSGGITNLVYANIPTKFTVTKGDKSVDYTLEIVASQEEYPVIFNTNGGSNIEPMQVNKDERATKPVDPIKEGYKFIGWYENANFVNIFNFDTPITKDITLYAKWEEIEVTIESVPEIIEEVDIGSTFELPKMIRVIMSDKNEKSVDIKNWNPAIVDTSKGGTFNFEGTIEGTDKKSKLTLTVKEDTPQEDGYTVTFNTGGGTNINPTKVKKDEKVSKPVDPIKENSKFLGWYEDSSFVKTFDFNIDIIKDITLYAKWEIIEKPVQKKDAEIINFNLLGVEGSINHSTGEIYVDLPHRTNLNNLVPVISYSEGATISPSIGTAKNFNSIVKYTVSGKEFNPKTYNVDVSIPREKEYEGVINRNEDWYRDRDRDRYRDRDRRRRDDRSWYEITQEIKKERLEKEERKTWREIRNTALDEVGRITAQSGKIRRDLTITQFDDYMQVKLNSRGEDEYRSQINIPAGVLTKLKELEFDYLKYNTDEVGINVYPFMDSLDGVRINIKPAPSEKNNDIQYIWSKIKGAGKAFEIESNSTKAGISFQTKLDKNLPAEYIRVMKYNYMMRRFEDLEPEKWSVMNGNLYVEQVSGGVYGVIYNK